MIRGISTRTFAAVFILAGGLLLSIGCGNEAFLPADGTRKPATCNEINVFRVLYVESLDQAPSICRLELSPPPGFEFVDKGGNRLPYHPFVLVKKGR